MIVLRMKTHLTHSNNKLTYYKSSLSKIVVQGAVSFGADADGLYIIWNLAANNSYKLSINTATKYLMLAHFDGTWTNVWSGTLN